MPPGQNANNNLNFYVFEVGMRTRLDNGDVVTSPIGVHPLLVVPTDITYTSSSASPVLQTATGSVVNRAGRNLWSVQMQGNFGVESRALGPYIGTGEVRHQRFVHEVVQLSEAMQSSDVAAALDDLTGTPGIRAALAAYDPERSTFYINFYDFFSQRAFSAIVRQWSDSRHYDRGGASGLVHYTMTVDQAGPLLTAALPARAVNGIMQGLSVWSNVNEVLNSYTPTTVIEGLLAPLQIGSAQLEERSSAVGAQASAATGLMAGSVRPGSVRAASLTTFLPSSVELASSARLAAQGAQRRIPDRADFDPGFVDWAAASSEGGSGTLDALDGIEDLEDLAEAAEWQQVAGALFGQSVESFQAFVAGAGGSGVTPDLAGSVRHTVGPADTEATLEERYGVPFDRILELNNLVPDEALLIGTSLSIPVRRRRGTQPIDGLPTLGSHAGEDAWGADLYLDLRVDALGDLDVVSGPEVLQQGVTWMCEVLEPDLINLAKSTPDLVRPQLIGRQLRESLLSDRRFRSVDSVVVDDDPSTASLSVEVTMSAINGGQIRTATGSS